MSSGSFQIETHGEIAPHGNEPKLILRGRGSHTFPQGGTIGCLSTLKRCSKEKLQPSGQVTGAGLPHLPPAISTLDMQGPFSLRGSARGRPAVRW